jgi:hypothetical protein
LQKKSSFDYQYLPKKLRGRFYVRALALVKRYYHIPTVLLSCPAIRHCHFSVNSLAKLLNSGQLLKIHVSHQVHAGLKVGHQHYITIYIKNNRINVILHYFPLAICLPVHTGIIIAFIHVLTYQTTVSHVLPKQAFMLTDK